MDIEVVRYNERYKALSSFGDNAALASIAAGIARGFDPGPDLLALGGVGLGLAFLVGAWHIRGLIQSED